MTAFAHDHFVVRFVTADNAVHEVECRDGRIADWRRARSAPAVPALEFHLPRVVDAGEERRLPFLEDPLLHRETLVSCDGDDSLSRLYPIALTGHDEPTDLLGELRMLWVLHDGPFGDFAWANAYVDGRVVLNEAVAIETTEHTPWDIIVEADFADCVSYFNGELEFRDMILRAQVQGSFAAMSAVTWFVERDEMAQRAAHHRRQAELLRDWVLIARSDETLAWVAQLSASEPRPA